MRVSRLARTILRPLVVELRRVRQKRSSRIASGGKRFDYFEQLVRLIEDIPGAVVECGVGAGKSLSILGLLTERGKHPRRVWAFDSFRGIPAPTREDIGTDDRPVHAGKFAYSESDVRARMISSGITPAQLEERFTFVAGYFPDGFSEYSDEPIAFLHLDVDLYHSYRHCLERFEPLVVPGGVIALDDYRKPRWVGATRAVDEYYGGPPPGLKKSQFKGRWYVIKPGAA